MNNPAAGAPGSGKPTISVDALIDLLVHYQEENRKQYESLKYSIRWLWGIIFALIFRMIWEYGIL